MAAVKKIQAKKTSGAKAKKPTPKSASAKTGKTTGKAKGRGKKTSSAPSTRARAKSPAKTEQKNPAIPPKMGRPKDSADVWTPEHIEEVADLMWAYIQAADIPSVEEFEFLYHVRHQRLGEFPALAEMREYLQAKRKLGIDFLALTTDNTNGSRVSYLAKMAANVGPFSMVDKSEFSGEIRGSGSRAAEMSPEERAKYLEERGWTRK